MKNECPYRSGDGQCTHKIESGLRSKKKTTYCNYNNEFKCRKHNEWLKLKKIDSEGVSVDLNAIVDGGSE